MNKKVIKKWWLLVIVFVVAIFQYFRPLPQVTARLFVPKPPKAQAVNLSWPVSGQSAIGAAGYGLLTSHGAQQPAPIGSTAKIITALAVLKQKPLKAGEQGPKITITQADVDLFNSYYSFNGSVTQVAAGEQITELQALESLLLPSSNNMADTLVNWAFGSKENYIKYANQMVKSLGLIQTTVGDTNGFSDSTTSTASDMVKFALSAVQNPAISKVVNEPTAQVPVEGTIKNTNILLGQDGIVGIKTGHTDKAGGNYIFASNQVIQGRKVTLVGAILNQPDITSAIQSSPALINSSDLGFGAKTIIHKGQVLGTYTAPWGAKANLVSPKNEDLLVWSPSETEVSLQAETLGSSTVGTKGGQLTISNAGQKQIIRPVLASDLKPPSIIWRLIR